MPEEKKYDVAISFAEEDRDIALALSLALSDIEGLSTYYYPEYRAETWGTDLAGALKNIYFEEAKYAIVLFSEFYLAEHKIYTKIELEEIRQRMEESSDIVYMLPVKLNRSVSLSHYPDLENLTYLEWNHNAKEIARTVKELLGKELRPLDENSKPGNILYSNGEHPYVIANSNILNFNQNIISNTGDSPAITTKDIEGYSITQQINFYGPKDTRFPCVNCSHVLDGKEPGKVICPKCGKLNYIDNPTISARKHNTLIDKDEEKEYGKILTHIRNKIKDKDYELAYQFCLKAEEMAPGEYPTWEHFALTEFLLEIYKERAERKSSLDIIKKIKVHIEKAKDFKISDQEYEGLLLDIANRLFTVEKSRISSLMGQYDTEQGFNQWPKGPFRHLLDLLKSFEICYRLCKDPLFLEEYVNVLSLNGKWIVKRLDDDVLINLATPIFFNSIDKLKSLVSKIKEHNPKYKPPEIQYERMIIKKVEHIKIVSIN